MPPTVSKFVNLTGQRFGKLTVLKRSLSKPAHRRRAHWICRCDCGRLIVAYGIHLCRHRKVSCGRCRDQDRYGESTPNGHTPHPSAEMATPKRRGRKVSDETLEVGKYFYEQLKRTSSAASFVRKSTDYLATETTSMNRV